MNKQKNFKINSLVISRLMTTIGFCALVVIFILSAVPASALDTGLEYGTYTGLGTTDLRITIMKIVRIFLGFVGIIAILIIMYGGYVWMTSAGNEEKISQAKKILTNAIIGLLIIFFAFAIVSFIINALQEGTSGYPPSGPPPSGCENCDLLGSGIIESVYPTPFALDVSRNTNIMVTFKVNVKSNTIIKDCDSLPCSGELISDNVKIFPYNQDEDDAKLADDEVLASTADGRTFVFNPIDYLGDGVSNAWYATKLTDGIMIDDSQSAFPGSKNYFLWRFEIGTRLDLDPVEIEGVFPRPDNEGDIYDLTPASKSQSEIQIISGPKTQVTASNLVDFPATKINDIFSSATVNGNYSGDKDAVICVSYNGSTVSVNPKAAGAVDCSGADITGGIFCLNSQVEVFGSAAVLGCGLNFKIDELQAGNQWYFPVVAEQVADTLKINNKIYTYGLDIDSGVTVADVAANIVKAINVDGQSQVTAEGTGSIVFLQAKTAGPSGNFSVSFSDGSGVWAKLLSLIGGDDPDFESEVQSVPDEPRNVVITIGFNEALDISRLPTKTDINEDRLRIEYQDLSGNWQIVPGRFLFSNQYQTVEFLAEDECKDSLGNPIINSCGDKIYCLPVNMDHCQNNSGVICQSDADCSTSGDKCVYEATNYRVSVKAGLLKDCDQGDPASCADPNFSYCSAVPSGNGFSCNNTADGLGQFYPEVAVVANGVADASNNSFNANNNTYILSNGTVGQADGPQEQSNQSNYNLNQGDPLTQGDDLIWSFYVNKSIDLTAPVLTGVGPIINDAGVSLTSAPQADFNKIMMSSTLKPDSGYKDGSCRCSISSDCATDMICENNKCKSTSQTEEYCWKDLDCNPYDGGKEPLCINRRYVSLLDRSTSPVAWWISSQNLDIDQDTWADITRGLIQHTKFLELNKYGADFGSGIKNVYQNCYLPSEGPGTISGHCSLTDNNCQIDSDCLTGEICVVCDPDTGVGCCGVSIAGNPPKPYCCNGVASELSCQRCNVDTERVCNNDFDCPAGQACVGL